MKAKKQKSAVEKHENRPNKSPQKRGARKHIHVLNNRQRLITPAASIGIIKQTLSNWSIFKRAKPNYLEKKKFTMLHK